MRQIIVRLDGNDFDRLRRLAERDVRRVDDQAAFMLKRGIRASRDRPPAADPPARRDQSQAVAP